jgi:hypothetical protein
MRRILLTVPIVLLVGAMPGRPADLPGREVAVVQGDPSKEATHRHFAWVGPETEVQVHAVGPTDITFVKPADDPRKKK